MITDSPFFPCRSLLPILRNQATHLRGHRKTAHRDPQKILSLIPYNVLTSPISYIVSVRILRYSRIYRISLCTRFCAISTNIQRGLYLWRSEGGNIHVSISFCAGKWRFPRGNPEKSIPFQDSRFLENTDLWGSREPPLSL